MKNAVKIILITMLITLTPMQIFGASTIIYNYGTINLEQSDNKETKSPYKSIKLTHDELLWGDTISLIALEFINICVIVCIKKEQKYSILNKFDTIFNEILALTALVIGGFILIKGWADKTIMLWAVMLVVGIAVIINNIKLDKMKE